ncbi:gluconate kinase, FGGY family [Lentzea xinjiangensis]|uniref:Gluconate kinase, FGGY family n=1 Tax=Lentzea xinjiangensis TaxID=402600 RepID=A0A1H9F7B1_9PSEU|nr:gluconokinase [Lentzea xinjiangensis]SEQ33755.1 gluconate kinase, FGGY family [Lentzea xinjiangensis]
MIVLAVDLGTTATKVVAVDQQARVVASTERAYPMRTSGLQATHDPQQVLDAVFDGIRELASDDVRAIALTGAMHTIMGLDSSLRPVTESLSWADNRAIEQTERLRGTAEGLALHQATGTPIHSFTPLMKLAWFSENGVRAAMWCEIKDFVHLHLTGVLINEHSCGSGTGLMNVHTLQWHEPSLEFAGVTADQLPPLVEPTHATPLTAVIPGLRPGIPVIVGGGDGPLGNLGVGAATPGAGAVSLGTSGALRVAQLGPGVDEEGRTFSYAIGEGLWVRGGAISNGGVVAQWAAETFGIPVGELLAQTAGVDSDGLVALPYLLGERAPWWDSTAHAALLGLRREHTPQQITKALVEGVCQQLALVLDAVPHVESLRITGGAFRAPVWAQTLANALGMPLHLAEDSGGSAVGAALLAWRALDVIPDLTVDLVRPTRTIMPDEGAIERYAKARPFVAKAYLALEELYAESHR